jgi:hypothetical protein
LDALEDRTMPSTFTVMNLNDNGPGSLRDAIMASNTTPGANTINFATGLHGSIALTTGELLITNSVAVNGPGAFLLSVSGNNASRVFEIATGQEVTISGLTITHGKAPDQGGGILNDGSDLTLSKDVLSQNVVFESTTDGARGGGMQSLAGTLTINQCLIFGNQALGTSDPSVEGLGLGGGIYVLAGTATIQNSSISNNLARGGDNTVIGSTPGFGAGGGIFTVAPTTIRGCSIRENVARGGDNSVIGVANGGGIYSLTSTISNSIFSGNQAIGGNAGNGPFSGEGAGGAIQNYGPATISSCIFDHNLAVGGNGGNSGPGTADPGVDEGYGAAICAFFGATTTVTSSTFTFNKTLGGNNAIATGTDIVEVGVAEGGAICNEIGCVGSFSGCVFIGNQAIGGSGNSGSGPVVHVGTGFGAGIFSGFGGVGVGSNTLTLSNTTFIYNKAQGGDNNSVDASVAGLAGVGVGGGIANFLGGSASVTRTSMIYNQAIGGSGNTTGGGGALFANLGAGGGVFNYLGNYNSSGYGPLDASALTFSNGLLAGNQALGGPGTPTSAGGDGWGGGLADLLSSTTMATDAVVFGNLARGGDGETGGDGLGGGFYNDATSTLALQHGLVVGNFALGGKGSSAGNDGEGIGGGVYNLGAFTFDALTLIKGNHASSSNDNVFP